MSACATEYNVLTGSGPVPRPEHAALETADELATTAAAVELMATLPAAALQVLLTSNAHMKLAAKPWAQLDDPPFSDVAKATYRQLCEAHNAGRAALDAALALVGEPAHPDPVEA